MDQSTNVGAVSEEVVVAATEAVATEEGAVVEAAEGAEATTEATEEVAEEVAEAAEEKEEESAA